MRGKHDSTGSSNKVGHDTVEGVRIDTGGASPRSAVEAGGGLHDTGRPVQAHGEAGVDAGARENARVVLRQATQAFRGRGLVYEQEPGDVLYHHTRGKNALYRVLRGELSKTQRALLSEAMDMLTADGVLSYTCPQCGGVLHVSGPECRGHCTACEQRGS